MKKHNKQKELSWKQIAIPGVTILVVLSILATLDETLIVQIISIIGQISFAGLAIYSMQKKATPLYAEVNADIKSGRSLRLKKSAEKGEFKKIRNFLLMKDTLDTIFSAIGMLTTIFAFVFLGVVLAQEQSTTSMISTVIASITLFIVGYKILILSTMTTNTTDLIEYYKTAFEKTTNEKILSEEINRFLRKIKYLSQEKNSRRHLQYLIRYFEYCELIGPKDNENRKQLIIEAIAHIKKEEYSTEIINLISNNYAKLETVKDKKNIDNYLSTKIKFSKDNIFSLLTQPSGKYFEKRINFWKNLVNILDFIKKYFPIIVIIVLIVAKVLFGKDLLETPMVQSAINYIKEILG